MKIEHRMFTETVRILREVGYKVTAETKGLYGYRKEESMWVEIRGISRQWGNPNTVMVSARKIGMKGFHPIAVQWFTGNVGAEKL